MEAPTKTRPTRARRMLRYALFGLACLATLIALAKIMIDNLHVHRLRQICIIIQEKLGARFGLPEADEAPEERPVINGGPKDHIPIVTNISPIATNGLPVPPAPPLNG